MNQDRLIYLCLAVLVACFVVIYLTGCASMPSGISVSGPGYVVSYDQSGGIAVTVKPSK